MSKRTVIKNPEQTSIPKAPEGKPADPPVQKDSLYKTPEEMEKVKQNLQTLAEGAASGGEPVKKVRKPWKKKEAVAEPTAEELEKKRKLEESAEDFALIGTQLLIFGVQSLPDPTPPSESEKMMFNRALNRCMIKWLPQMDKWGAEIALVASCAVIALPRLQKPKIKGAPEVKMPGVPS